MQYCGLIPEKKKKKIIRQEVKETNFQSPDKILFFYFILVQPYEYITLHFQRTFGRTCRRVRVRAPVAFQTRSICLNMASEFHETACGRSAPSPFLLLLSLLLFTGFHQQQ